MQITESSPIRGRKMLFTWNDGPTKGKTYEHEFHENGTVEFHAAGAAKSAEQKSIYAAERVADGVYAVSYLATGGYTLTAVLNFGDRRLVGFASDASHWYPVHGSFEVVA
ncbi:MAG TPA: MoaF N-terminal domain-containing protein [Burkholderiales bacterium]|jgi:hypothetical protein